MKLLLTSAGIRNASIHAALLDLLCKPIADCTALCIPTALYGHSHASPEFTWRFISGRQPSTPMAELGWKSVGVLELTALPSLPEAHWMRWVNEADVLLVNGGDAVYLTHWMRQSGLAKRLESMPDKVWVGLSAGSMCMTPRVGAAFVEMKPSITGDDLGLGVVDFAIFPHLDHPGFDENTMAKAEVWAADIGCHSYAIDDQTAIKVVDGKVEVVSEGH
ncbi:peptidase E [soil metagenome]